MSFDIKPINGPNVWRGIDCKNTDLWTHRLSPGVMSEISAIVHEAQSKGRNQYDFRFELYEIPRLRKELKVILNDLAEGPGFSLIRGINIDTKNCETLKLTLQVIGHHMGLVGPQENHPRSIGEVRDVRPEIRTHYYHGGGPLPMHMDPIDAVGLFCIRAAKQGGESRIVSSAAVHNEILKSRPDLLNLLYRGFKHRRRKERSNSGSSITEFYCPIFAKIGGKFVCNYIPRPIRWAVDDGLVNLSKAEEEALSLLDITAACENLCLHMDMQPGDLQFLNNRFIMHGRSDYVDFEELEKRRFMLRLWLTIPSWPKFPSNMPHSDVELKTTPA